MVLVGLVVVVTRGSRDWRLPTSESPDADAAVAGTHGQAPEPGVKAADQLEVSQRDTPATALEQA